MRTFLSWLIAGLLIMASVTFARDARADDEAVVVDITEAASDLDAGQLRALIAKELHVQAIKPGDPGARSARGTLTIDVDRQTRELSVTYLARASATTRHVPLPADAAAARNDAVTLAGNLARDEASELAAALRKQAAPIKPAATASPPADDTKERAQSAARLQAALDGHASREAHDRTFMWTAFFAGNIASGSLSALSPGFDTPLGGAVSAMSSTAPLGVSVAVGALPLFAGSSFDKLADTHRKTGNVAATEERWRESARVERTLRRVSGILELSFGAVAVGAGTIAVAKPSIFTSQRKSDEFAAVMYGFAAAEVLVGIYLLTSEGPVESGLHTYERTTGRVAPPREAWLRHFGVGLAPGGATASFATSF